MALLGAGVMGAAVNGASGRAVLTWFASGKRGMAMGIRQTATPVAAAVAAAVLPAVAVGAGIPDAFWILAALHLSVAVAVVLWVRDPPGARQKRATRGSARELLRDGRLLRMSLASGLLIVPQFTATSLMVELLYDHRGLGASLAAALLGVAQILGGVGRLAAGAWSDAVRSRFGPLRLIAVAVGVGFAACAALDHAPIWLLCAVLLPTAGLAICWTVLPNTAAGEIAPAGLSGMALGINNTAIYLVAAITPPAIGWVAVEVAWPVALMVAAASAVVARLVLRDLTEESPTRAAVARVPS
ncbi:MFS transporter [Streptomyces sp. 8N616]|uniref:MFS transporter n=1 Tax=Streptomyces sp. 8N616 TaxID=3457414 RepID=UPI003FD00BD9